MRIIVPLLLSLWAAYAVDASASGFRDCPDCPDMVAIPAGSNVVGTSPEERARQGVPATFGDREGPQHDVRIARPFALGRTEITRGHYARFVVDTRRPDPADCAVHDAVTDRWTPRPGFSWRRTGFEQRDDHPAVCIAFEDASAYVEWLSRRTGESYRLPSESEWEYAARAGARGAWYWGEVAETGCEHARLISSGTVAALGSPPYWQRKLVCVDARAWSAPVTSYPANAFGLYDMAGNAFEWVADCASASHAGAPPDGSARSAPACAQRFLKGGAFHTPIWLTRAGARGNPLKPDLRMATIGFRVARDLRTGQSMTAADPPTPMHPSPTP